MVVMVEVATFRSRACPVNATKRGMRIRATATANADAAASDPRICRRRSLKVEAGPIPLSRNTTAAIKAMPTKFVTNSSAAPRARSGCPHPSNTPTAASGGTTATATATPGRAEEICL